MGGIVGGGGCSHSVTKRLWQCSPARQLHRLRSAHQQQASARQLHRLRSAHQQHPTDQQSACSPGQHCRPQRHRPQICPPWLQQPLRGHLAAPQAYRHLEQHTPAPLPCTAKAGGHGGGARRGAWGTPPDDATQKWELPRVRCGSVRVGVGGVCGCRRVCCVCPGFRSVSTKN